VTHTDPEIQPMVGGALAIPFRDLALRLSHAQNGRIRALEFG
jgi:hypothetical protein